MKILHYVGDRSGVFLYRAYFPSIALMDNTEHNFIFAKNCSCTNPHTLKELHWCDIAVFHRQRTKDAIDTAKYLKGIGKKVVYEIDDDWWNMNDDNPFYQTVKDQPEILREMELLISKCDIVTVTNERLATKIRDFNQNVKVIPNFISQQFLTKRAEKQKRFTDDIVLFWSGAQNHLPDLKLLIEPMNILFKKYRNLHLCIVGHNYTDLFPFIAKKKLSNVPWMNLDQYPSAFTWADIGLAPMADNLFSASKSNIRVLELANFGVPIVASNIYAYRDTISHGKNGFLASNTNEWVKYLSDLIESKELRKQISIEAERMALGNSIEENYHVYDNFYKELCLVN